MHSILPILSSSFHVGQGLNLSALPSLCLSSLASICQPVNLSTSLLGLLISCLPIYMYMYTYLPVPASLPVYLSWLCLSVSLLVYFFSCPPVCLSSSLPVRLSACPSLILPACLPVVLPFILTYLYPVYPPSHPPTPPGNILSRSQSTIWFPRAQRMPPPPPHPRFSVCRGLFNYITCKGTLRQLFIMVYRLKIQSAMLVFSSQLCEPSLCE
jgi:hypothetical protein